MDENKMMVRVCALCRDGGRRVGARLRGTGVSRDGSGRTRREHDGLGGAHEARAHRDYRDARESRSQFQNRASCLRKLHAELERRGRPPRRRVKTKVPQRSRQRRLNDKHFNAIKKANRRKPGSDE